MHEPEYSDTRDFMIWARENKRRADNVVEAARAFMAPREPGNYSYILHLACLRDLQGAIAHYEERD